MKKEQTKREKCWGKKRKMMNRIKKKNQLVKKRIGKKENKEKCMTREKKIKEKNKEK